MKEPVFTPIEARGGPNCRLYLSFFAQARPHSRAWWMHLHACAVCRTKFRCPRCGASGRELAAKTDSDFEREHWSTEGT